MASESSRRERLLRHVRRMLRSQSSPRWHMSLVVLATGAWGCLVSWLLWQWGLHSMALRYPLAVALSYPMFIALIGLWLHSRWRDWADWPVDTGLPDLRPTTRPASRVWRSDGGGDFAGAGASASFDAPATAVAPSRLAPSVPPRSGSGDSPDWSGDGWELAVLGLALGGVAVVAYVVYLAPVLLAEVLVDGALSWALLRRLRGIERRHWTRSVLLHTWLPFVLVACLLAAVGWVLQQWQPGAHTLGQVLLRL